MGGLMQTLRNLGPARLGLMGAVMVGMLVFFFFLTSRMSTGQMALLYNDLPTSDAGAITAKLDALQIPFTVSADGSQIKVPAEQVGKLRMTLAADGLPSGGGVGYEIFDKQNGFGTTTFVQNINQVRALEGELARTISSLQGVRAARVHLVLPHHEMFAKETEPATASVFLTLKSANSLGREQIAAVQHLVAAAVPQLKPNAISIIDNNGNLLARGGDDGGDASMIGGMTADENRHAYEARVVRDIEDLLGRTVGYGKVRATVTADLDFDRVTTSQEKYDPEGQVARSTQTTQEKSTSSEGAAGGAVSVANNLPEGKGAAGGGSNSNNNDRTEETTNYEVSKTVTSSVKEIGAVKKLSVAVLVDGTYSAPDKDGKTTYAPRSPEEMKKLEDLVKSAIGFDDKRGDAVKIENMEFAHEADAAPEKALPLGLSKDDLGKMLETVVLGLVAVLFILLVVRPLTTKVMAAPTAGGGGGGGFAPTPSGNLLTDQSGAGSVAQLSGPGGGGSFNSNDAASAYAMENEIERMINLEQVEGRVRASSLKKISEIVDKHPEQAVGILRNWLYQDSGR